MGHPPRPWHVTIAGTTTVRSSVGTLDGVCWESRELEWVGPRPATSGGLPPIGRSNTCGVSAASKQGARGGTFRASIGMELICRTPEGKAAYPLAPVDLALGSWARSMPGKR